MERLLGLDVGTKRIGVAVGDDMGIVISGKEAIKRSPEKDAIKRITVTRAKTTMRNISFFCFW